ncbi:biotin/lipoyl-containing protein [Mesoaciditoga lauensis]|uniref:biotin/lipoyl-containing protein n=1 Tax=Mesoaciditoga lauensis TaxID=1495039 RepID=UPI000565AC4E|nr:biotin/lipoyl-containing protein [Mesoaciditoga lauensis]
MGKKYLIKVNGKMYEVEVEEMGNSQGSQLPVNQLAQASLNTSPATANAAAASPQSAQSTTPVVPQAPANPAASSSQPSAPSQESTATTGGEEITAPMSGVVLKVNVKPGDVVKDAQTLIVIEAMKMENEILAPHDGKIKEVLVKEQQQVEMDQPLLIME